MNTRETGAPERGRRVVRDVGCSQLPWRLGGDAAIESPAMEEYFRQIAVRTAEGERVASAVVVSSRGSTPQDIGARMLFFLDGSTWGTVGGGCVEADVRAEAVRVLADGRSRALEIDLIDDIKGEGDVCGGTLEVLLESWTDAPLIRP